MPMELLERSYLGEAWNHVLRPEGAAPPLAARPVGTKLWLRTNPQQIAVMQ
jgi:hypothetical protein